MSNRPTNRTSNDEGQAAVELALVLPLIAALVLGLVQTALLARDQVLLVHAAREAARAAAIREGDTPAEPVARRAATRAAGPALDPARLTITAREHDGRTEVEARYRARIDVPLLQLAARYVLLGANAQMNREKN